MLTPTRTSSCYTLQSQGDNGWFALCHYSEDRLEDAVRHCSRAVMVTKATCRVIENCPTWIVVCERFYNREDDTEARDWDDDEYEYEDEDLELSWQQDGF